MKLTKEERIEFIERVQMRISEIECLPTKSDEYKFRRTQLKMLQELQGTIKVSVEDLHNAAMYLYEGKFIRKNIKLAIIKLVKAAHQEHKPSIEMLNSIYQKYIQRQDRDIIAAVDELRSPGKRKRETEEEHVKVCL